MKTKVKEKVWFGSLAVLAVAILIMIGVVVGKLIFQQSTDNLYPLTTIVSAVDYERNTVSITDSRNITYQFKGAEDWHVGANCAAIMDDNGTKNPFDDKVIKVRFCGQGLFY